MKKYMRWFDLWLWVALIYVFFFVKLGDGQRFTVFDASKYCAHQAEIDIKSKILARKMMKSIEKYQKMHEMRHKLEENVQK